MTQQVYSPPQNLIAWCELNKWWLHVYMKMKVAFWGWMLYFSHLKPHWKKGHSQLALKVSVDSISIYLALIIIVGKQNNTYFRDNFKIPQTSMETSPFNGFGLSLFFITCREKKQLFIINIHQAEDNICHVLSNGPFPSEYGTHLILSQGQWATI